MFFIVFPCFFLVASEMIGHIVLLCLDINLEELLKMVALKGLAR